MKILNFNDKVFKQYLDTNIYSSNCGLILKESSVNRLLTQTKANNGYLRIATTFYGNQKSISSHRIIAICWIENIYNKPQVNHINGIKQDNRVDNLEWNTAKENTNHSIRTGLQIRHKGDKCFHYGKRGSEANRAKKVIDNLSGKIYNSLKDVVIDSLYSYKSLSKQLTGTIKNKTNFTYL
jgi:hypothetical protein